MFRSVAVILTVLAVLLHGAGGAFHATKVVYLEPHAHPADSDHHDHHWDHWLGDPHHLPGDLADPSHDHDEDVPDHRHVAKADSPPSQPRSGGSDVPAPVLVAIAIAWSPEFEIRPTARGPRVRTVDRWGIGPPPSIKTTRLLI